MLKLPIPIFLMDSYPVNVGIKRPLLMESLIRAIDMEDSMILLILTGTYTKECQMNSISIFTRLLTVMFKH